MCLFWCLNRRGTLRVNRISIVLHSTKQLLPTVCRLLSPRCALCRIAYNLQIVQAGFLNSCVHNLPWMTQSLQLHESCAARKSFTLFVYRWLFAPLLSRLIHSAFIRVMYCTRSRCKSRFVRAPLSSRCRSNTITRAAGA